MKVLLIDEVCGHTSTGKICGELAHKMSEEGHEVKIAYGRSSFVPEEYRKYAIRIGNDWDVRFHALQTRIFDTHGFGSRKATRKFLKWADYYNPDLVWLHNLHGYYINVELLFQWIKTHPEMEVRWTLHDCWAFTGHCVHFTCAGCYKWKTECRGCGQLREYPANWFFSNTARNFRRKKEAFTGVKNLTIYTPSQWLKKLAGESFLKEYKIEVQRNQVNKKVFRPTESSFRRDNNLIDKKIILGVANRWVQRKGLQDFIDLASWLDDEYRIVLVGLSSRQIKSLPPNVIGLRKTNSQKELAAIYTAADVFVNPSREETFGMTPMEAGLCGTPAVVMKGTACEELEALCDNITAIPAGVKNIYDMVMKITSGVEIKDRLLKVLFLTNIPSPNRVAFFNELGKRCDLTVTFELHHASDRDEKWVAEEAASFKAVYLKGMRTSADGGICPGIIGIMKEKWDAVIIGTYYTPTSMIAMEYMMAVHKPYIIEADGGFVRRESRAKYLLKHHFISNADLWFSSGKFTTDYLVYYGAQRIKCHIFPFTSLKRKDLFDAKGQDYRTAREHRRRQAKIKLSIEEEFVVLTVSQVIKRKGLDVLLKASKKVEGDMGFYIVGGDITPELDRLKGRDRRIHFEGFHYGEQLKEYFLAADIFVLPTREDIWGLVVNEAMTYGLPVITTDHCGAGLELIENGENGIVLPAEDIDRLAEAINFFKSDRARAMDFGYKGNKKMSDYTLEDMADTHMRVLYNEVK